MPDASPARRSSLRLIVVPALLFAVFSGGVFTLSKLHLAKASAPRSVGRVVLGDPYRGSIVFSTNCAACHGEAGAGGGVGPKLAGSGIAIARVKAQIDAGGATMPPALVSGAKERDVLAYLVGVLSAK